MPTYTVIGLVDTSVTPPVFTPVAVAVGRPMVEVADLFMAAHHVARGWAGAVDADDADAAKALASGLAVAEVAPPPPPPAATDDEPVAGMTAESLDTVLAQVLIERDARLDRAVNPHVARTIARWWCHPGTFDELCRLGDGEPFRPAVALTEIGRALERADDDQITELHALRRWLQAAYPDVAGDPS